MKFLTRAIALAIFCGAGVAHAEGEPSDPTVKARVELMKSIGGATKTLGDMAGGKTTFDAAAAEAAKTALVAASGEIAARFETQATDPASEAKPEIWTSWEDFVTKATALNSAASALDAGSVDGIKAGMAGVGGACKACHSAYRM